MLLKTVRFLEIILAIPFSVGGVSGSDEEFTQSAVLDPDNVFRLHWRHDDSSIEFQVEVRTLGYFGLGFSPNGGMKGSDIIVGWVDDENNVQVRDCHAPRNMQPEMDSSQDIHVISGSQNLTHTSIRFLRLLDTCDEDDRVIGSETVRVIWSHHARDPDVEGRMLYHGTSRGSRSIFFLATPRPALPPPQHAFVFNLFNKEVAVPERDTFYWCQSFALPKVNQKHHLVKLEPVIQAGHESLVHHILVYGCFHPVKFSSVDVGHECYHNNMPQDWWDCNAVMFAWAIGGGSNVLPEHVGIPIGTDDDPEMIVMETHYDNQVRRSGIIDSSGLRLTLTSDLRTYDGGVIQMGNVVTRRQAIPPFMDVFTTAGHCLPECTERALVNQTQGIHLFGVTFHTHLLGRAMRLRHFRNGTELPLIAEDKHYDFNLQQQLYLPKEVKVLPGDGLITECDYDSSHRTSVTMGGLSTSSEMCLSFVVYYPRVNMTECATTPSEGYLNHFLNLTEHGSWHWTLLFQRVDWRDKALRQRFQDYVNVEGVSGFTTMCRKGKRLYIPENMRVSFPAKLSTLPPPGPSDCSQGSLLLPSIHSGSATILVGILSMLTTVLIEAFKVFGLCN